MKKKTNTLPWGFQTKLKNITNPDDIIALAEQLSAMKQGRPYVAEVEIEEEPEVIEHTPYVPQQHSSSTGLVVRSATTFKKESETPDYTRAPWYDPNMNDTEASVIDLYGKGMTLRDISNFFKRSQGIELSGAAISSITDRNTGIWRGLFGMGAFSRPSCCTHGDKKENVQTHCPQRGKDRNGTVISWTTTARQC
jgi:hypothetical protein